MELWKKGKKESLKNHPVGEEGMDWWVFPGYTTRRDDLLKIQPLKESMINCQKIKNIARDIKHLFINISLHLTMEKTIKHVIRFNKLVESLIGMTANNTRTQLDSLKRARSFIYYC